MNPTDAEQVREFMRWLCDQTSLGWNAVSYLCLFFFGLDVVNELKHEIFVELMA